ncbi:MAG TPA: nucleotidyltransferase family protein [Terriglobales bacterium]|nr:nucleotidyltransferase family protein [Terriglobales bacterium]
MIWAVVLAAGESRRMGTQKLLLSYGGTTVVEAVVRAALDSEADRTLVVLGADREKVRRALESYPLTFAVNRSYRRGMLSSVQAAFRALPAEAEAAVVMLGDQPAVASRTVDELVLAYRGGGRGIYLPVYGERPGHPLLVDTGYRSEVLGLDPAVGLRQLLQTHQKDVVPVRVSEGEAPEDMDNPEDYEKLVSRRR